MKTLLFQFLPVTEKKHRFIGRRYVWSVARMIDRGEAKCMEKNLRFKLYVST